MITQDIHPLDPRDAEVSARFRTAAAARKGRILGPEARPMFDAMRAATPCAAGARIEPGEVGGVTGVRCCVSDGVRDRRLLFLHGGYMLGSAAATANFASQLATRAGADTFVPDYRLAPEHPFPAAFLDALAAYRGLASGGEGSIALAGESAGGGLTLALLAALGAEPGGKAPVAAAVMSPWTDLALTGASYRTRAAADPIFNRATSETLAETYLQGQDPDDPRASPLRGPMRAGPSLRIDVGADEVLLDDARACAARAAQAGTPVTLAIWEGMPHVFQA
jgi:monoterpene epsilon-lactone hydrolase